MIYNEQAITGLIKAIICLIGLPIIIPTVLIMWGLKKETNIIKWIFE